MSKKKKLIPELRFPEFENDEEWEEKNIEQIAKVSAGGTPESTNPEYWHGNIPWMNSGELNNKRIYSTSNFITKKGLKESSTKLIPPKCVLIGLAGQGKTRGTAAINYIELCTNQSIGSIHPNRSVFDSEFLYQKIDSMYEKLRSLSTGDGGRGGLNLQIIKQIKVSLPQIKEQKKIASCLSSLDEVIEANSQKLDLLKDHKKGLMQNLFPQEGEKVPKYRFKEFEKDGEWVEKKLGDVAEIITGNTPSTNEPLYYGGDKMFVSPADISDKRIVSHTKTTLTDLGFSKTRQIKEGSVLFVCIGSTIGKVAQNKYECATNQQLNSLIANSGYSNDFLYSILYANSSEIASMAGNHAVPIINKTSFSIVSLFFPPSLKEQQKIAWCLSSIDELITTQVEKIEQLKQHKKGLMQCLFPKLNDI